MITHWMVLSIAGVSTVTVVSQMLLIPEWIIWLSTLFTETKLLARVNLKFELVFSVVVSRSFLVIVGLDRVRIVEGGVLWLWQSSCGCVVETTDFSCLIITLQLWWINWTRLVFKGFITIVVLSRSGTLQFIYLVIFLTLMKVCSRGAN